jgi:putative transcriptional regulator
MNSENVIISKTELSKRIGQRIKELRAEKGLTQTELSKRMNKDRQHIEMIENGKLSPNVYTLYIVATGLETKAEALASFNYSTSHPRPSAKSAGDFLHQPYFAPLRHLLC